MSFEVRKIFEDLSHLSKVHTKKEYAAAMDMFRADRFSLLRDLTESGDYAANSLVLCQDVQDEFKKFGKVRAAELMNLNYFMIYYVFPTILSEEEKGAEICDTLRDVWNERFKCNINYTDYETLKEGFQTKIFGIPIGKN